MIKSMTGFGRGEFSNDESLVTVEIKSVNHRYNDIVIKKPKHLNYIEEDIRKFVKNKVNRGRIEVYIHIENTKESDFLVKPDITLAKSYINAIDILCKEANIDNDISINTLISFPELLKVEKVEEDEDKVFEAIMSALDNSIQKMNDMRISEGEKLGSDIKKRANFICETIKEIEKRAPKVVLEYKEKLTNRINELLDDKHEIDDSKLANEIAFYSDKGNITEEIVRLYSHIDQLKKSINSTEPIGRKLDFLVQEMNREVNTIGSKVGDVIITNYVVDIKSELEKIREQIQNIE